MKKKKKLVETESVQRRIARPAHRRIQSGGRKGPNKGQGKDKQNCPKADLESYFDTKQTMSDQDLKELNRAIGSTCTEQYTVETPDGPRHLGTKFNTAPGTNQNDNVDVGRIVEATRTMLYQVFGAWDADTPPHEGE